MKALLVVDVQYDFLPGGALAVKDGDQIIPIINKIQPKFDLVVATQDWHPTDHGSFAANHKGKRPGEIIKLAGLDQVLWPVHCLQHTAGAAFHHDLDWQSWDAVFQKGINPVVDSYSGFYDNNRMQDTGLSKYLKNKGVKEIYVVGLATDYCVKYTVLDAISEGFETYLVEDATRGVNILPEDSQKAVQEMVQAGARVIHSESMK